VTGEAFYRDYDGVLLTSQAAPATVSNFQLDTYEITVGRFRKFVAAYPGSAPAAGSGKNPNNASDTGWDATWNTDGSLEATAAALTGPLKCGTAQTWTDAAGTAAAESLPITCLDWFEAEAFCIWDGGRLPTEAEWNYAAAGGSEQRVFPWSVPSTSTTVDGSNAVYNAAGPAVVGSKSPKGDGLFGQADLAGNVWEWVQDWYDATYILPCNNCANLTRATTRVLRGTGFLSIPPSWYSSYRNGDTPSDHFNTRGARCARSAP
jgi:formylglycine-generating enzyme required for sulfatase activity